MCVSCIKRFFKKSFSQTKPVNNKNLPCPYEKEDLINLLNTLNKVDIDYNYVQSAINNYENNCHLFKERILKLL